MKLLLLMGVRRLQRLQVSIGRLYIALRLSCYLLCCLTLCSHCCGLLCQACTLCLCNLQITLFQKAITHMLQIHISQIAQPSTETVNAH